MATEKSLIDMTDQELMQLFRARIEHVDWSPNDCLREMDRRATDRHTREMRSHSWVTAVLALVATVAAVVGALK